MAPLPVVVELGFVVGGMLIVATATCVGLRRFVRALTDWRRRLAAVVAPLGVLVAVLTIRWATKDVAPRISFRVVDNNVTTGIYAIEGHFVAAVQSLQTPWLSEFFVFTYMYVYVLLITFPFVVYFTLDEEALSTLLAAYALNYGIGLVCYVLFIAFGPRNYLPTVFDDLLYTTYPQARYLTGEINQSSNVFPSLHVSLSSTAALLAWRTRDRAPLWAATAPILAALVALSTMYLGIHWLTDVVAGVVLAVLSVHLGSRVDLDRLVEATRVYLSDRTGHYRDRYGG